MNKDLLRNQALWTHALYFDPINQAKIPYSETFASAGLFNEKVHLLFVGMGDQEKEMVDDAMPRIQKLVSEGYNIVAKIYPGHHEWDVWRKCACDMLPLLFKW